MGDVELFNHDEYVIQAKFTSASGLREGAYVEIAGVTVGKVKKIEFDPDSFLAVVDISLPNNISVSDDSIA